VSVVNAAANISSSVARFDLVAKKFGIDGSPYILYVGNIEPRKNLVRLLKAFALLKEKYLIPHKLVMVGASGWNNVDFYRELAANRFRDDIVLTGYVTSDEKNAFYQNAAVFVFPSIYEGFGLPPLEAMRWRCPVVAANAASLPEVCGEAAELVDPFYEETIAEGLLNVISDTDRANELRERGVAQESRFSWENAADGFCSICKEVIFE
jgi:glycosyltransferase involved in cell wall biosynthesis